MFGITSLELNAAADLAALVMREDPAGRTSRISKDLRNNLRLDHEPWLVWSLSGPLVTGRLPGKS
ncbi:MAG: hypothetical protein ACP5R5_09765 [Armatimonadota bacterium]